MTGGCGYFLKRITRRAVHKKHKHRIHDGPPIMRNTPKANLSVGTGATAMKLSTVADFANVPAVNHTQCEDTGDPFHTQHAGHCQNSLTPPPFRVICCNCRSQSKTRTLSRYLAPQVLFRSPQTNTSERRTNDEGGGNAFTVTWKPPRHPGKPRGKLWKSARDTGVKTPIEYLRTEEVWTYSEARPQTAEYDLSAVSCYDQGHRTAYYTVTATTNGQETSYISPKNSDHCGRGWRGGLPEKAAPTVSTITREISNLTVSTDSGFNSSVDIQSSSTMSATTDADLIRTQCDIDNTNSTSTHCVCHPPDTTLTSLCDKPEQNGYLPDVLRDPDYYNNRVSDWGSLCDDFSDIDCTSIDSNESRAPISLMFNRSRCDPNVFPHLLPSAHVLNTADNESLTDWDRLCNNFTPPKSSNKLFPSCISGIYKRDNAEMQRSPESTCSFHSGGLPDRLVSPFVIHTSRTPNLRSVAPKIYTPQLDHCNGVSPPRGTNCDSITANSVGQCGPTPSIRSIHSGSNNTPPTAPVLLKSFLGYSPDETWALPFHKDELFVLLSDRHRGWLLVENSTGNCGYIPSNYVTNLTYCGLDTNAKITYC